MKRIFDIIVSIIILLLFLPFGIVISLFIAIESPGGIFYKQKRVGRKGMEFDLYKFRSMRPDSDRQGKLTIGDRDPRITRAGYFIRKFKLDEFPQFFNVLKGDMSIVGPRPEVREYVDLYTEEERNILKVRPGITDYASIEYFEEAKLLSQSEDPRTTYVQEVMPAKIRLNQKYIENPTLWQDLKIMGMTFRKMIGF